MHAAVTYLHNVDENAWRGYEPGHALRRADATRIFLANNEMEAVERAFMFWNADDRPNGRFAPSMSVGDVVKVEHNGSTTFLACERLGWKVVPAPDAIGSIIPA